MTKLAVASGVSLSRAQTRARPRSFALPTIQASCLPTTVTASAVAHTKGAWTELIAATAAESTWMVVTLDGGAGVSATDTSTLLDIGVGAALSEDVRVPGLSVGFTAASPSFAFPLRVPKGSRVAARIQSAVSLKTVDVVVRLGLMANDMPAPLRLLAMGIVSASSRGTDLATAAADVEAAWTEITAATTQPLGGVLFAISGAGDTTQGSNATNLFDLGVGAAGSEVELMTNVPHRWFTTELIRHQGTMVAHACSIPSGSRIAGRWTRGNVGDAADMAVYGVPVA